MILIDSVFINNGGGKIVLDYLFDTIAGLKNEHITILIDHRIRLEYEEKNKKASHIKLVFINGFAERNRYYKMKGKNFSKVLCFGNIPPSIRLTAKVFTYFHQPMYLNIPKDFGFIERQKFRLKVLILRYFAKNTDFWLVQSDFIKESLGKKFNIKSGEILKVPFYPPFKGTNNYLRKPNSFIFVSNANPHKNHIKLINSFCRFYDKYKTGTLILTVNDSFPEVKSFILEKQSKQYPIKNIGFVDREVLYKYYQQTEYLIFPSQAESFGLGIVEAIENGCKVIGADLPYMYEACNPSLVFDPNDENSIYMSFEKTIEGEIPESRQKIYNKIDELIKLLTNKQ